MKRINPQSSMVALWSSQPHSKEKADELMNVTRTALVRMLDGTAEDRHFMRLGVDVNLAAIRAQQIGATEQVVEVLTAAGEALKEAEGIHERHGRYGLTGLGRQALSDGIDAFEEILRASSPRQMHEAEKALAVALRRMERAAA